MNDQSHLKNTLPSIDIQPPSDCPLKSDPHRSRMDAEQCGLTINCLIRNDGPRDLKLSKTTGLKGSRGEEWVEAESSFGGGFYRWGLWVRGGMITNCFMALTPKGSEYCMAHDGGNPFDHVTIEDRKILTHMLLGSQTPVGSVEVVPAWIVAQGGARPYSAHLFYSEAEAEEAAAEQRVHFAKYNKTTEASKEAQSTEKAIAKEQKTIAFRATGKGIKKTKK